ncbi:hypothetical protein [Shewanella sp. AS1]|nr:hypothetical protein [Shewanella sp. AS1]
MSDFKVKKVLEMTNYFLGIAVKIRPIGIINLEKIAINSNYGL